MGNSMGKKRKMASAPSKKNRIDSHVVSLTSSSLNNMTVEFPKEIEEDLERRKIESFKALAAGSKKPIRTTSDSAPSSDPAHELYERMRKLDVPAMMVPKPWSEVDELFSKHKPSGINNEVPPTPRRTASSPLPRYAAAKVVEAEPETIDMWELMDDLDEGDEDGDKTARKKNLTYEHSNDHENASAKEFSPRKVRTLETSLSFSTIHTVKEVEGSAIKPEMVTNVLKARNQHDSSRTRSLSAAQKTNATAALAATTTTTPRKVNVNPRLLARVEAFS